MDRRILGFPLIAAALAGCGPFGSTGQLQTGAFGYECSFTAPTADLGCTSSFFQASDIPGTIAVGAHFDLKYNPNLQIFSDDPAPIVASLAPAAPAILGTAPPVAVGSTGFSFSSPGTVAVLARTADGSVVDFVHVTGVALDHVVLQDALAQKLPDTLVLPPAGTQIQAVPEGPKDQPLAGGLTYTWTSSDETVVKVAPINELGGGAVRNQVTLQAVGQGSATVSVQVGDQQASIPVTVAQGGTP